MAKLKHLKMYEVQDAPDHLVQEIQNCTVKIAELIEKLYKETDENIILCSLNWVHASCIKRMISEDSLQQGALLECKTLLKNIEFLDKLEKEKKNG